MLAVNRGFMEKNRDAVQRLVVAYLDVLQYRPGQPAALGEDLRREGRAARERGRRVDPASRKLDATLPLESIKRISKFLSDNGVITRDVSGDVAQSYTYDFLSQGDGQDAASSWASSSRRGMSGGVA